MFEEFQPDNLNKYQNCLTLFKVKETIVAIQNHKDHTISSKTTWDLINTKINRISRIRQMSLTDIYWGLEHNWFLVNKHNMQWRIQGEGSEGWNALYWTINAFEKKPLVGTHPPPFFLVLGWESPLFFQMARSALHMPFYTISC